MNIFCKKSTLVNLGKTEGIIIVHRAVLIDYGFVFIVFNRYQKFKISVSTVNYILASCNGNRGIIYGSCCETFNGIGINTESYTLIFKNSSITVAERETVLSPIGGLRLRTAHIPELSVSKVHQLVSIISSPFCVIY